MQDASYSGSVESSFGGMIISDSTNELKRGFRFNLRSLNVQNAFRAEAGMVLLAFRVLREAQQLGVTDAKILLRLYVSRHQGQRD